MQRAAIVVFLLDAEGVILEANNYASSLSGEVLKGVRFQDVLVEFARILDLPEMANDSGKEHLLNVRTRQGTPRTLYFSFYQTAAGIYALGRPMDTEDESLIGEITSLNRELSNLTRELQKKTAELAALNQLKNQFLGMATHDLRKPIGLILAYTDFLLDDVGAALGEEQLDYLTTIRNSSESMQLLIEDFLDVAMIESGSFNLNLAFIETQDLIDHCVQLVDLAARKKGVSIVTDVQRAPRLYADGPKLEQALANLLGNAVEHSGPGSKVVVSCEATGSLVSLKVRDDGDGIPLEEQRGLFNPFSRGSTRKTGRERSIGLGLAIANKIIEGHRGKLSVDSTPGEGSCFGFTIPVDQQTTEGAK